MQSLTPPSRVATWRIVVLAVAAMLLTVSVVAVGWLVWMPDHRPALREGEVLGVDVSHHQGRVDWPTVAADGIAFAYVKATEGADHVDRRFTANWHDADSAGMERGAYHFFTLCRSGDEQAENFLATVPPDEDALPPALDLELGGNCADRPHRAEVEREVGVFVDMVERQVGRPVVLYVGDDWEAVYPTRGRLDRPVWYRQILRRPPTDDWWIWQVNYRAEVDGIDGGADLDVMRTDRSP